MQTFVALRIEWFQRERRLVGATGFVRAAGRDPDSFPIAKRVYIGVDDDLDRARKRMAESLERLYGYFGLPDLTPVAAFGPPEVCAQALRDVADAGARLIVLNPLYDDAAQMDRLAREVIPNVTKTAASR
jgi:hypothetical protein